MSGTGRVGAEQPTYVIFTNNPGEVNPTPFQQTQPALTVPGFTPQNLFRPPSADVAPQPPPMLLPLNFTGPNGMLWNGITACYGTALEGS